MASKPVFDFRHIFVKMWLSSVILRTVHFFVSLYTVLLSLLHNVKKPLNVRYFKQTVQDLKADSQSLGKIPVHIGIVIVEDEISFIDIAKIAVWCMTLGISCISIYDRKGTCKQDAPSFEQQLDKQQSSLLNSQSADYDVHIHPDSCSKTANGHKFKSRVDVHLLSLEDGRRHLVATASQLSQAVKQSQLHTASITPTYVDTVLQERRGCPDPDLVLCCGAVSAVMGFLPWHIRLSEILWLPSHIDIDYTSFLQRLQSFSHTQQRFGK